MDLVWFETPSAFLACDADEVKTWEEMNPIEISVNKEEIVSDASFSETSDMLETWGLDMRDMELTSEPGIPSDDEDEDVFMQLEENEGLLPPSPDEVIGNLPLSSSNIYVDIAIPVTPPSRPRKIMRINDSHFPRHGVLSMTDQQARFEAGAHTLRESMLRSRNSRERLCGLLRDMENYQRTGNLVTILYSVEFSTRLVDSFCRGATTNTQGCRRAD
mmetsp:Transcript_19190/g.44453  ORF Transcript_19190/g.44453 Transcript_19190/m.44453 type:complete len:217 (+) Transcript_19190:223-873(+)